MLRHVFFTCTQVQGCAVATYTQVIYCGGSLRASLR